MKELWNEIVKSIKYFVVVLFLFVLYLFIQFIAPSLINFKNPSRIILSFVIGGVIICWGFIISFFIFRNWKIDTIKNLESKSYEILQNAKKLVDYWEFKDLVINVNNYFPKEEMVVYGVNFSKTAEDPKERERLLNILNQKGLKKVTFICTAYSSDRYTDIAEHVREFIRSVADFKKIKSKIEIYGYNGNLLRKRLILLDHNLVLYQPGISAKEEFNVKIQDLAIKINDTAAIIHYYGEVEDIKNKSENVLEKVLKEMNL